jgi:dolichol kinase
VNDDRQLHFEAWRKALHLSTLLLPVWILWADAPWRMRGLVFAFLFFLTVDVLRLRWPPMRRWLHRRIHGSLRTAERERLTSAHYLTFSACVLAWALPASMAATIAVPVGACGCGTRRPAVRSQAHRAQEPEGSAAFVTGMAAGWLCLGEQPLALAAAVLAATIVELLPLPVDDNLSVPLVTALVLRACV